MYQALYRKYRSKTFAELLGQPQVTDILRAETRAGRISHAYLFTGTRGTGKTSCARILAKAVNCLHPVDGEPCNECEICRAIQDGSLTDVAEIDAASNSGVDTVRALRDEVVYSPAVARYRVYIIDEVHMLSAGAWGALLKTLEEPPAHVIFILATTEAHKIPATILSRCQRFDFRRIGAGVIKEHLLEIAAAEGLSLTPDAAALIAKLGDGAMRDALSILDKCAFLGREIDYAAVAELVGITGRDYLFRISRAVREGDAAAALETLAGVVRGGTEPPVLCQELLEHYRDLLVLKTSKEPDELLIAPPENHAALREAAAGMSLSDVLRCIDCLQTTLDALPRAVNRQVALEASLVRLCCRAELAAPADIPSPNTKAGKQGPSVRPSAAPMEPAAEKQPAPAAGVHSTQPRPPLPWEDEAPVPAAPPDVPSGTPSPAAPPDGASVPPASAEPLWQRVLAHVASGRYQGMLKGMLGGTDGELSGKRLRILVYDESHVGFLSGAIMQAEILRVLQALTGETYILRVEKAEPKAPPDDMSPELKDLFSKVQEMGPNGRILP